MPTRHTIEEGEGVSSLALVYGMTPERIWNDPANDALRQLRPDPNVLLPGDVVVIPDRERKQVPAATGRRHVFRRVGVPAKFRMQFLDRDGQPRAGMPWSLTIGARSWSGTTDGDGRLDIFVPNDARRGVLQLGEDEELDLDFGGMDPLDSPTGVQKRLRNLGFATLRDFQQHTGLPVTGELDDATRAKLQELHDTSATW